MEELIRVSLLNDELNDVEFSQFIIECIKLKGREFFTKALFKAYEQDPESIIPLANITTNIINSRKSNKKQQINTFNHLDTLPSELITKCSAFLQPYEYIQFGYTNRKIYKSIYYPTSNMAVLSMQTILNWPQTKSMRRFKNITQLYIDIDLFTGRLSPSNKSIWKLNNQLNTIHIEGEEDSISNFIANKQINLANITKLELSNVYPERIHFCEWLKYFPKLEHLQLDECFAEVDFNLEHENIIKTLTNLKHCGFMYDCSSINEIITALSSQLESLKLTRQIDDEMIKFPKLKQLYFVDPETDEELSTLLDRVRNLEIVQLEFSYMNTEGEHDYVTQFVSKVIHNQLSLQQLGFKINFDLMKFVMSRLEYEMYSGIKSRKSDILIIEFDINDTWQSEWMNDMYLDIMRLISSLEKCQMINDFKVKVTMENQRKFNVDSLTMKDWLSKLEMMKESYLISYQFAKQKTKSYNFVFSISNKYNKIDVNKMCNRVF